MCCMQGGYRDVAWRRLIVWSDGRSHAGSWRPTLGFRRNTAICRARHIRRNPGRESRFWANVRASLVLPRSTPRRPTGGQPPTCLTTQFLRIEGVRRGPQQDAVAFRRGRHTSSTGHAERSTVVADQSTGADPLSAQFATFTRSRHMNAEGRRPPAGLMALCSALQHVGARSAS